MLLSLLVMAVPSRGSKVVLGSPSSCQPVTCHDSWALDSTRLQSCAPQTTYTQRHRPAVIHRRVCNLPNFNTLLFVRVQGLLLRLSSPSASSKQFAQESCFYFRYQSLMFQQTTMRQPAAGAQRVASSSVVSRRPLATQALFGKKSSTAVVEKPAKKTTSSKTTSSKTVKEQP